MTIIATLPAGRYAIIGADIAAHIAIYNGGKPIVGLDPDGHGYVVNYDDFYHRGVTREFHPVPGVDGLFDTPSGPGVRVTLDGIEKSRAHSDSLMMTVQRPEGSVYVKKVMVVVPATTMEHDRVSGGLWRIVESEGPLDVDYGDLVLTVGGEVYDLGSPQFYSTGLGDPIRPGDGVYEVLGCATMDKGPNSSRVAITRMLIDRLHDIGTPHAMKTLERVNHFGIGGMLDVYSAHVRTSSDDAPVHLAVKGSDTIIRHGSPVYDLLAPKPSNGQMEVVGIGQAMIADLRTVGGAEADLAIENVEFFMEAQTGGRAYFSPWRERLPLAA